MTTIEAPKTTPKEPVEFVLRYMAERAEKDQEIAMDANSAELVLGEVRSLRRVKDAAAVLLTFVPEQGATIKAGYGKARQELFEALADYYDPNRRLRQAAERSRETA